MEFKWLDDFMSLRELGNFSAAAQARYVTQSAFSRRIQALEIWVGVTLFDRTSYPIELTEHGKKFVPYVESLLEMVRVTKDDFSQVSLKTDKSIRIVCLHSFAVNLLPRLFNQLEPLFEGLNFAVTPSVQGIDNHFQALLNNSNDILFAYNTKGMRPSLLIENKLDRCLICKESIIPVISPQLLKLHPNAQNYPYLAYSEHTFLFNAIGPLIERIKLPLEQIFETTLSESLIKMAINGAGIAWVPVHTIKYELEQNLLIQAFPEQPETVISLDVVCYRSKNPTRSAINQFWQGLTQCCGLMNLYT